MTKIAVVYHSRDGHTEIMAGGVLEGAASVAGVEASLHAVVEEDFEGARWSNPPILESLDAADGIIFGCPTWMGSVSTPLKAFFDATLERWYPRKWKDKVAAGFTVSSSPSGDKLNALSDMFYFALQHGMVWVGMEKTPLNAEGINRLSVYLGAAGQAEYGGEEISLMGNDRRSGVELGERVARLTAEICAGRTSQATS